MKISVFGSGYVGLVTSVCFAEMGNLVVCIDIDEVRIKMLQEGDCPIYEPGLTELLKNNLASGRLFFTSNAREAIINADIIFIAVGTPPKEDGSADMRYVLQVAKTIGNNISEYKIIANKSTVPVGAADRIEAEIQSCLDARKVDCNFEVISNPEFLKEGNAVSDCMKPDRIVVGARTELAIQCMRELYAPFIRNHDVLVAMDVRSAELTKYAANAMLAAKISFMNEVSQIAEKVGADIEKVRIGIGSDPRIGFSFIYPGCGYGGSCFPKDVQALYQLASESGYQADILGAVHAVNERQRYFLFEKIKNHYKGQLQGKTFAVWGLAFKPNTDDIREAPSRVVIEALWQAGATIRAYDPEAMNAFAQIYQEKHGQSYQLCKSPEQCIQGADALIIFTEWMVFRSPNFDFILQVLNDKVIFDGRNLYDPNYLKQIGIRYYGIGRGQSLL